MPSEWCICHFWHMESEQHIKHGPDGHVLCVRWNKCNWRWETVFLVFNAQKHNMGLCFWLCVEGGLWEKVAPKHEKCNLFGGSRDNYRWVHQWFQVWGTYSIIATVSKNIPFSYKYSMEYFHTVLYCHVPYSQLSIPLCTLWPTIHTIVYLMANCLYHCVS